MELCAYQFDKKLHSTLTNILLQLYRVCLFRAEMKFFCLLASAYV